MKLFLQYLKQRRNIYALCLLFLLIFCISFLLYHLPVKAVIYPSFLCFFSGIIISVADFKRIKQKHEALKHINSITDVTENSMPETDNIENNDYKEIIRIICEEHNSYCTEANEDYFDMVDYYTVWAHQIKTPIASMRLTLQNEDSPLSRKIYADLHRIEQYVEMVLTFLRLNSESSDYLIKEYNIDNIVKQAVKKFSHEFIGRKIGLNYKPINETVITDEKWLCFVIEQILSNALKYTKTGNITISLDNDKRLVIRDTGIGIAPEDLPRIFEKGYTGIGGRTDKKASGLGLYLCKCICSNLGHDISAESEIDKGTVITIDLSPNNVMLE